MDSSRRREETSQHSQMPAKVRREQQRLQRKQLDTARQGGRTIDLSDAARRVGLDCHCEVGRHLWTSLFWNYPSASPQDVVKPEDVLRVFRSRLENNSTRPGQDTFYIWPPCPPWWMRPSCFLKLKVFYRFDSVDRVLIMSQQERLMSLFSWYHPPLPASLLVQLLETSAQLTRLCVPSNPPLLASLDTILRGSLRTSPLAEEIGRYLDRLPKPRMPAGFSREQFREIVVRTLVERLELAAAVADKIGAEVKLPVSAVMGQMAEVMSVVPLTTITTALCPVAPWH